MRGVQKRIEVSQKDKDAAIKEAEQARKKWRNQNKLQLSL